MATPQSDPPAVGRKTRSIFIALGAFAVGFFAQRLAQSLGVNKAISELLPFMAAAAAAAGAAAAGMWHPQWLGHRSETVTWVTLRLIIVVFAIVTIVGVATRPVRAGCPLTYTGDISGASGDLLYSEQVGRTLVCTYDYQGGL